MNRIFKKKREVKALPDILQIIENDLFNVKITQDSLDRRIDRMEEKIPELAREVVMQLAHDEAIRVISTYRDEEFLTKIVADRIKELKHKEKELEKLLSAVDDIMVKIKEVIDEQAD